MPAPAWCGANTAPAASPRWPQRTPASSSADETAQQIAYAIDADIVQYLDLSDVGAAKNAPGGYGLSAVVSGYNPNWLDEERLGYGEAADAYRLEPVPPRDGLS